MAGITGISMNDSVSAEESNECSKAAAPPLVRASAQTVSGPRLRVLAEEPLQQTSHKLMGSLTSQSVLEGHHINTTSP